MWGKRYHFLEERRIQVLRGRVRRSWQRESANSRSAVWDLIPKPASEAADLVRGQGRRYSPDGRRKKEFLPRLEAGGERGEPRGNGAVSEGLLIWWRWEQSDREISWPGHWCWLPRVGAEPVLTIWSEQCYRRMGESWGRATIGGLANPTQRSKHGGKLGGRPRVPPYTSILSLAAIGAAPLPAPRASSRPGFVRSICHARP